MLEPDSEPLSGSAEISLAESSSAVDTGIISRLTRKMLSVKPTTAISVRPPKIPKVSHSMENEPSSETSYEIPTDEETSESLHAESDEPAELPFDKYERQKRYNAKIKKNAGLKLEQKRLMNRERTRRCRERKKEKAEMEKEKNPQTGETLTNPASLTGLSDTMSQSPRDNMAIFDTELATQSTKKKRTRKKSKRPKKTNVGVKKHQRKSKHPLKNEEEIVRKRVRKTEYERTYRAKIYETGGERLKQRKAYYAMLQRNQRKKIQNKGGPKLTEIRKKTNERVRRHRQRQKEAQLQNKQQSSQSVAESTDTIDVDYHQSVNDDPSLTDSTIINPGSYEPMNDEPDEEIPISSIEDNLHSRYIEVMSGDNLQEMEEYLAALDDVSRLSEEENDEED